MTDNRAEIEELRQRARLTADYMQAVHNEAERDYWRKELSRIYRKMEMLKRADRENKQ